MKNLAGFFFISLILVSTGNQQLLGLGRIDDVARVLDRASDVGRAAVRTAPDIIKTGIFHADDIVKVSVLHADDFSRMAVSRADDIARLGLRQGDDLIYGFSQIHRRSHILKSAANQIDDIAMEGLSRKEFRKAFINMHGAQVATDLTAYTGKQNQLLQAVARGEQLSTVGSRQALQRVNRINDFLNSQTIKPAIYSRGINVSGDEVAKLYNISGNVKGKNPYDIADMIKNKTTYNPAFTSASLPDTPKVDINEWAIYGLNNAENNNFKIIRELNVPIPARGGSNISKLNIWSQDEFLFHKGLMTRVTDARVEKVLNRAGKEYTIIRVLETVVP
jgi:hypothetical protein